MALLEVDQLTIEFGGLKAVDNFNIIINEGELIGLIGPNGAGKTTVFNMLTGVYRPTHGRITLNGKNIIGLKPDEIVKVGAARTFQNIRLFKELSVMDNIKIAFHKDMKYTLAQGLLRLPMYWKEEKSIEEKAIDLLKLFNMEDTRYEKAKNLPYGKQRKLEIARALATSPKLLLLDEPAAGMNPQETLELMNTIRFIKDKFKTTILLIEHDMNLVMGICERLVVIDYGKVIAKGTPDQIKSNDKVIKAYLGGE